MAAAVAAGALAAGIAGWRSAESPAEPVVRQDSPAMSDAERATWVEKNPEKALADRAPPSAESPPPKPMSLAAPSAIPNKGVSIAAAPKIEPPKASVARIEAPTVEMMAASKGGRAALAVDKDGFATLPSGERTRVSMRKAEDAAPAQARQAIESLKAAEALAAATAKEEARLAKAKAEVDGNGNAASPQAAGAGRVKQVWIKTKDGERQLRSIEIIPPKGAPATQPAGKP